MLDRLFERVRGQRVLHRGAARRDERLRAGRAAHVGARRTCSCAWTAYPRSLGHVVRVVAAAGQRRRLSPAGASGGSQPRAAGDALRDAVAAGVLVPAAADAGTYEFRHALLRETAYSEVLPGEREPLHAALARELQDHPEPRRRRLWPLRGAGASLASAGEPRAGPDRLGARRRAGRARLRTPRGLAALPTRSGVVRARRPPRLALAWTRPRSARPAPVLPTPPGSTGSPSPLHGGRLSLLTRAVSRRAPASCTPRSDAIRGRRGTATRPGPWWHPQSSRCRGNRLRNARGCWSCRLACCCSAAGRAKRSNRLRRRSQSPAKLGLQEIEAAAMTSQVIALHGHVREAADAGRAALRAAQEADEPETC